MGGDSTTAPTTDEEDCSRPEKGRKIITVGSEDLSKLLKDAYETFRVLRDRVTFMDNYISEVRNVKVAIKQNSSDAMRTMTQLGKSLKKAVQLRMEEAPGPSGLERSVGRSYRDVRTQMTPKASYERRVVQEGSSGNTKKKDKRTYEKRAEVPILMTSEREGRMVPDQ